MAEQVNNDGIPVVALVASAGGLDALLRVLSRLPVDLPAAVLVALHQEPDRHSELVSILARRTALPVVEADVGSALRAGVVLVAPPTRHLLVISPDHVGVIATGDFPPSRPSGDLLLATLAVSCGRRAVAVILSGSGHDAQAGVRAIAYCGGVVLAQDEDTSRFFAMPAAAIATGSVSEILGVDDLAAAIATHVGHAVAGSTRFPP